LEHPEIHSSSDTDITSRLLKYLSEDKISGKDYLWVRNVDKLWNLINKTEVTLARKMMPQEAETKKLLAGVVKDALSYIPTMA